jgi:hypothetical protein
LRAEWVTARQLLFARPPAQAAWRLQSLEPLDDLFSGELVSSDHKIRAGPQCRDARQLRELVAQCTRGQGLYLAHDAMRRQCWRRCRGQIDTIRQDDQRARLEWERAA